MKNRGEWQSRGPFRLTLKPSKNSMPAWKNCILAFADSRTTCNYLLSGRWRGKTVGASRRRRWRTGCRLKILYPRREV